MGNEGLVSIGVEQIYQHPDNPRRDLGDLTELTESIKKKGVMQNLTVIPGHWLTDEEYKQAAEEYKENPTEEQRQLLNDRWKPDGYTLLIGHRRCAAAKAAGLAELPCRIVAEMSKKDQVSTMLEENMQRNDLTIWEQANGFQMMLNLGDTEEQIAEKTGFSKTTIRHRLNIAKLNQNVLKDKEKDESFQLTLSDLYALEQVEDIKTRDKILKEATSSRDLSWKAKNAAEEAHRDKVAKETIEFLKAAGVKAAPKEYEKEMYSNKWETVQSYSLDKATPKRIAKNKFEDCFYYKWYREVRVVKKKDKSKEPETEFERRRKEKERNAKKIKAIAKEMAAQRADFVRSVISGKTEPLKDTKTVLENLWKAVVLSNGAIGKTSLAKFLADNKKSWYDIPEEDKKVAMDQLESLNTLHQIMVAACVSTEDLPYTDWENRYKQETGNAVLAITEALNEYGFSYSEDEYNKVMEGSHECYNKEK